MELLTLINLITGYVLGLHCTVGLGHVQLQPAGAAWQFGTGKLKVILLLVSKFSRL